MGEIHSKYMICTMPVLPNLLTQKYLNKEGMTLVLEEKMV